MSRGKFKRSWVRIDDRQAMIAYFEAHCSQEDRGYSTPCRVWQGFVTPKGYGQTTVRGKNWKAHRLAFASLVGPIPEGMTLDHLCMVKLCCNPEHLEPVTAVENTRRAYESDIKWGAPRHIHCKRGHPFSEQNTYIRPDGSRECSTCKRGHNVASRLRKKLEVA